MISRDRTVQMYANNPLTISQGTNRTIEIRQRINDINRLYNFNYRFVVSPNIAPAKYGARVCINVEGRQNTTSATSGTSRRRVRVP